MRSGAAYTAIRKDALKNGGRKNISSLYTKLTLPAHLRNAKTVRLPL